MRVIKITQDYKSNLNFVGRKNKKNGNKKQEYNVPITSIYNPTAEGAHSFNFSSLVARPKSVKSAHPYLSIIHISEPT